MKLSLTNEAARKLLRRLENDTDPDMREAVGKIEQALQPGMMLASDELRACVRAVAFFAEHQAAGTESQIEALHRAIPKLETLLQKTLVREGIEAAARGARAAVRGR